MSLAYNSNPSLQILFNQLQQVVRNGQHPFFITHIHAHTALLGPMARGNAIVDSLVGSVQVAEATRFHSLTHTNAGGLCSRFPLLTNRLDTSFKPVQPVRFLMLHRNDLKE